MLKTSNRQNSFYDVEYVCEGLIPPESYYRKFREVVWPLVKDEDFAGMYCEDNGRPPISPALLARAMLLQFHQDLSDRDMERACMYDIEVKYALGLRLDERPFDHSSLGDFRKRLLEHGRSKLIFENILQKLIAEGLIRREEIQRIDATHVIADVAIPTVVTLVKKGVREILKPLKGQQPKVYEKIIREIKAGEYTRENVNCAEAGNCDLDRRKQRMVELVRDARQVLKALEGVAVSRELRKRMDMLRRILRENVEDEPGGGVREREFKAKPKDILVTPVDEDARYGSKTDTKKFTGYKATITESVGNRFITNIEVMRGNRRDAEAAVKAVVDQKVYGLVPARLIGDKGYSDGINRKLLNDNGTTMVAPLPEGTAVKMRKIFPKSMFRFDDKTLTLRCPQGVETRASYVDRLHGLRQYHFPVNSCRKCKVQKECTREKDGRRTVGISAFNKELREAEVYNATDEFKVYMKLRPAIEGKLSEMTRYHGLRRARYRGLEKVNLQGYFTAAAVNIKRWIRLILAGLKGAWGLKMAF